MNDELEHLRTLTKHLIEEFGVIAEQLTYQEHLGRTGTRGFLNRNDMIRFARENVKRYKSEGGEE